jgi:capsid protein
MTKKKKNSIVSEIRPLAIEYEKVRDAEKDHSDTKRRLGSKIMSLLKDVGVDIMDIDVEGKDETLRVMLSQRSQIKYDSDALLKDIAEKLGKDVARQVTRPVIDENKIDAMVTAGKIPIEMVKEHVNITSSEYVSVRWVKREPRLDPKNLG